MHLKRSAIAHCTLTTLLQQLHRPVHAAARTDQAHTYPQDLHTAACTATARAGEHGGSACRCANCLTWPMVSLPRHALLAVNRMWAGWYQNM